VKIKTTLFFNFEKSKWPDAQEFFKRIGRYDLADKPKEIAGYIFEFYDSEDSFNSFIKESKELGLLEEPFFIKEKIYTTNELLSFPLLWLDFGSSPIGDGGPTYGTKYDMSHACPVCGTGATQDSELFVKASEYKSRKDVIETYHNDILLSRKLVAILEEAKVSGLKTYAVVSHKDKSILPWFQLLPEYELPPMSPLTCGIRHGSSDEAPCSHCHRDGYFISAKIPTEIYYESSKVDIDRLPDIMRSYEHFGNSFIKNPFSKSKFAPSLVVVKPKIFDLFKNNKIKGVNFHPILIK